MVGGGMNGEDIGVPLVFGWNRLVCLPGVTGVLSLLLFGSVDSSYSTRLVSSSP